MGDAPVISIVVPVYNSATTVRSAISSALAQSFSDLEIICVNDGSTDDSLARLAKLSAEDARVRVVELETNRGVSFARNMGIEQARGRYVFFLDADDFLPIWALEHLLVAATTTDCELALGKLLWTKTQEEAARFESPNVLGAIQITTLHESVYLQSVSGSHCCNLYRKDLLDRYSIRYDIDLIYGEDQLFQTTAIAAAGRVALLDEIVYVYQHYHGQSITRKPTTLDNLLTDLEFHRRIARLMISQELESAGADFLRTWPYSIREYWLQIPDVLSLAQATTFFSAFRSLINEFGIVPWNEATAQHHQHLLSLVLMQRDQDAYHFLTTAEARHGRV